MQGLWLLTCIGASIGGFFILMGFAQGAAPAQAATFACAVAFAVVPYVFTRSIQGMAEDKSLKELKRIAKSLEEK